jgi:hypothetical protein
LLLPGFNYREEFIDLQLLKINDRLQAWGKAKERKSTKTRPQSHKESVK